MIFMTAVETEIWVKANNHGHITNNELIQGDEFVYCYYIVAILQHFLNTFVEAMNEDEKSLKCLIH